MKWIWMIISGAMTANFAVNIALKKSNVDQTEIYVPVVFGEQFCSTLNMNPGHEKNPTDGIDSEIEFKIREAGTSKPIANAAILLEDLSGKTKKLQADLTGNCKSKLKTGHDYQCYVYAPGFEIQTEDIESENFEPGSKEVVFINLLRTKR